MRRAHDLNNLLRDIELLDEQQLEAVEEEFLSSLTQLVHREGAREAVITSAVPLTNSEKARMRKILTVVTGHDLEMDFRVQESVLGGFRIKIGDWKLDATLTSQLGAIQQYITV